MAISPSEDANVRARVANDRLKNLNASLYYVKGINGDMIPTESVYATFVKPLQEYVENFNDRKYINTSLVGAQIDGFENMTLEDALINSEPVGDIGLNPDFKYDEEKIYNNLKNNLEELKSTITYIEEGKKLAKNLNNDIKRYRNANAEVLKTLKKLSENYLIITGELAKKIKLLDFITIADKTYIDYEMKMVKEFTYESVLNINLNLTQFYKNTENRILEIERLINESINTAG